MTRIITSLAFGLLTLTMAGTSASAKGDIIAPQPAPCASFDVNGDGGVNLGDWIFVLSQSDTNYDAASFFKSALQAGCTDHIIPSPNHVRIATACRDHFGFCDAIDMNGDEVLAFDDLQAVLGGSFSVMQRLDALLLIHGDGIASPTAPMTLRCLDVDMGGILVTMSGLFDTLLERLETCFDADMNGDGVLNIADTSIIWNPKTPLSIPERIAYHAAVNDDALCDGNLY